MDGFLTARGKAAGVRVGHAKVLVRINGCIVDTHFVVKVWSGRATAKSDVANGIATVDVLAGDHGEIRQVPVTGADSVPVIYNNSSSIAPQEISIGDHAIGGSHDRGPVGGRNVYAAMEGTLSVKGIDAFPE